MRSCHARQRACLIIAVDNTARIRSTYCSEGNLKTLVVPPLMRDIIGQHIPVEIKLVCWERREIINHSLKYFPKRFIPNRIETYTRTVKLSSGSIIVLKTIRSNQEFYCIGANMPKKIVNELKYFEQIARAEENRSTKKLKVDFQNVPYNHTCSSPDSSRRPRQFAKNDHNS